MEKAYIRDIINHDNVARISIFGVEDIPGKAFEIFSVLAKQNITVDIILQATGRGSKKDITFTAEQDKTEKIVNSLYQYFDKMYQIEYTKEVSKISIIGSGMINHPGIAASVFEAVYDLNIDIQMVSTSEMNISLIIDNKDALRAVEVLREKFNI